MNSTKVKNRKFKELVVDTNPFVRIALDTIRELHFRYYGDGETFEVFVEGVGQLLEKKSHRNARELAIRYHSDHLLNNNSDTRYPLLCIALAYLEKTQHAATKASLDTDLARAEQFIDHFNVALQEASPQVDQAGAAGEASRSSNKLVRAKMVELLHAQRPPQGWPSKAAAYRGILESLQKFIADHNAKHPNNAIKLSEDNLERRLGTWSLQHPNIAAALTETMSREK